jgi:hypothetical protein
MIAQKTEASFERQKRALLTGLVDVRARILSTAAALPPRSRRQIFLGTWDVRDLLAHLVGWDYTNTRAAHELARGELPTFYRHADRDWRSYNAILVRRYGEHDFRRLTSRVRRSHRALLKLLEAIPAEEMWKDRGIRFRGWKVNVGRLMEAERRDEEKHWRQIKEFAESLSP